MLALISHPVWVGAEIQKLNLRRPVYQFPPAKIVAFLHPPMVTRTNVTPTFANVLHGWHHERSTATRAVLNVSAAK